MLQAAFVTTSGMLHAQFGSVHTVFSEPRLQCSYMMQPGEMLPQTPWILLCVVGSLHLYMGWGDQTRVCRPH